MITLETPGEAFGPSFSGRRKNSSPESESGGPVPVESDQTSVNIMCIICEVCINSGGSITNQICWTQYPPNSYFSTFMIPFALRLMVFLSRGSLTGKSIHHNFSAHLLQNQISHFFFTSNQPCSISKSQSNNLCFCLILFWEALVRNL